MRVVRYARLSQDRPGENTTSIERQLTATEQTVKARSLQEIAPAFIDRNISAYSGKPRPAYRDMVRLIQNDGVEGIVVFHMDRLYRSNAELEELIELATSRNVSILSATGDSVDLSTSDGQLVARILVAVARKSSDDTRRRVKNAKEKAKAEGKYLGGGRRPYGYSVVGGKEKDGESARIEINPEERAVIRSMVEKALQGESIYRITADLNNGGIPNGNGNRWKPGHVKRMLLSPFHAGLVASTGKKGEWPAVISEDEHNALVAILNVQEKKAQRPTRKYLLSGLVKCSECGTSLTGSAGQYRCDKRSGGCGKVSIYEHVLDQAILDILFVEWESQPPEEEDVEPKEITQSRNAILQDIAAVTTKLDDLPLKYAAGILDDRAMQIVTTELKKKKEALEQELRDLTGEQEPHAISIAEVVNSDVLDRLSALTDQERQHVRDFVTHMAERITLKPGRGYRPERIEIEYAA